MPLHTELWFPSPIWSGKFFNVDNQEIKQFAYDLKQKTSGVQISNAGGWQSDSVNKGFCPAIDQLIENLDREILEICKQVGLPTLEIYNVCININPRGAWNIKHDHVGAVMTGVYYVESVEGNGNIRFERADTARFFLPQLTQNEKQNYFNTQICEYKSITNAVYIFPAWLPHSVQQNVASTDRISISFNYGEKNA